MARLTDVLAMFLALAMIAGVTGLVCLFLVWMRHADQSLVDADARARSSRGAFQRARSMHAQRIF
jgi:hypothetical protein